MIAEVRGHNTGETEGLGKKAVSTPPNDMPIPQRYCILYAVCAVNQISATAIGYGGLQFAASFSDLVKSFPVLLTLELISIHLLTSC